MRAFFSTRGRRVVAGAAVLLAVSASIAYAAIPDAGQTFSACVLNGVGTVRLIDTSKSGLTGHCTSLETPVSWNAKGQAGPTGLTGAAGDPGAAGTKGDTGAPGATGDTGARGPTGDTGAPGPKGDTGDTGAQGPVGHKGDPGAQGSPGAKGDTGDIGPAGEDGQRGATGAPGAQGLPGLPGDTGPQGATGAKGPVGPTGAAGADGTNDVFIDAGSASGSGTVVGAGDPVHAPAGGVYVAIGEAQVTALDGPVTITCAVRGGARQIGDTFTTSGTYTTHQLMTVAHLIAFPGVQAISVQCTDTGNTGRGFSISTTLEVERVGSVIESDQ